MNDPSIDPVGTVRREEHADGCCLFQRIEGAWGPWLLTYSSNQTGVLGLGRNHVDVAGFPVIGAVPGVASEPAADVYSDLTARLAAADIGWGMEHGDPPANPDYIRWLARQVAAFKPSYLSAPAAADVAARCPSCEHRLSMHAPEGCVQEIAHGPNDEPDVCPCAVTAPGGYLVSAPVSAEDEAEHVIEIRDDGWTIMHPLSCRPNLFDCAVNRAAGSALTTPPMEPGRYPIELRDDGLFINDMPVQGTPYRDAGAAEDEAAVERIARALHRGAWERDIANGTPLEGNDVDACWSQVGAKYREWYYADARAALAALREGERHG